MQVLLEQYRQMYPDNFVVVSGNGDADDCRNADDDGDDLDSRVSCELVNSGADVVLFIRDGTEKKAVLRLLTKFGKLVEGRCEGEAIKVVPTDSEEPPF